MLDEYGDLDFTNISPEDLLKVQAIAKWIGHRLEEFRSARSIGFYDDHVFIELAHLAGCHCHGQTEYDECQIPNDYFFSTKSGSEFLKNLAKKHEEEKLALQKKEAAERAASQIAWEKQQLETLKKKYGD